MVGKLRVKWFVLIRKCYNDFLLRFCFMEGNNWFKVDFFMLWFVIIFMCSDNIISVCSGLCDIIIIDNGNYM